MTDIGYFDLDGITLRQEPARDACFTIVRADTEMAEFDSSEEAARREMIHRHMSNEITSIDIAAQCIADFPDAPWPLRMELARQCYDETRHVRALYRRLAEIGGYKGEFPGRLATQNRSLEAGAMDVVAGLIRDVRASGDEETAYVLDAILADEVQHVRFANRWIKALSAENPRVLFKVAHAIRFLAEANTRVVARAGDKSTGGKVFAAPEERIPAVNIDDRKLAEFSDAEVHEILKQAGFRVVAT